MYLTGKRQLLTYDTQHVYYREKTIVDIRDTTGILSVNDSC